MPNWLQQWRALHGATEKVLTMNQRNLGYVYPHNARSDFPIANDKLLCKEMLAGVGVPLAKTHFSYRHFYEMHNLDVDLLSLNDFVIKPSNGSAGNGILVVVGRDGGEWIGISGKRYRIGDLRKHIADIIFGVFSHDKQDAAIIEQRIEQHSVINSLYDRGLSDVRIILFQHEPVLAMSRVPTLISNGKANLHQGAVGLGLDLKSGRSFRAMLKGKSITVHPDSDENLIGVDMPFWDDILRHSVNIAKAVPLKYIGVDIAVAAQGPVLLEINARPGLEIQNVTSQGMRPILESL